MSDTQGAVTPKIKQTAQQRANTEYALNVMWPRVSPDKVTANLADWCWDPEDCGSPACFGGWVVRDPFFLNQDIEDTGAGAPVVVGGVDRYEAARHLFGDYHLFRVRGAHPCDSEGFEGTDHKLVTHRLQYLLANSEVVS